MSHLQHSMELYHVVLIETKNILEIGNEDARFGYTVVSEKKVTFLCELKLERYIYLRNTQKQLKITSYGRYKSFLELFLVYNGL